MKCDLGTNDTSHGDKHTMEPVYYRMTHALASRWVATVQRDDLPCVSEGHFGGRFTSGDSNVLAMPYNSSENAYDLCLENVPQQFVRRVATILVASGAVPNLPINDHRHDLILQCPAIQLN